MSYLLQSKYRVSSRYARTKRALLILALAILTVLAFQNSAVVFFLSSTFQRAALPIWQAAGAFGESFLELRTALREKASLQAENENLSRMLDDARVRLATLSLYEEQSRKLQELLNRRPDGKNAILAKALVKPPRTLYDMLILDVGADHDIRPGMRVAAGALAVGEIVEVYGKTSKAKLYSTPGETVTVSIGGSGFLAQAEGQGGGNFRVRVPKGVAVRRGDPVAAPDLSIRILGVVGEVTTSEQDAFEEILFGSPINISELEYVEIIP